MVLAIATEKYYLLGALFPTSKIYLVILISIIFLFEISEMVFHTTSNLEFFIFTGLRKNSLLFFLDNKTIELF